MDFPRADVLRRAQSLIDLYGQGTVIYFAFTCPYCDARCRIEVPNELPIRGACWQCSRESAIYEAGFAYEIAAMPEEGETD